MPSENSNAASNSTNTHGSPSINAPDTAQGPIYNCELFVPPTTVAALGPSGFPFTVRCIYDSLWPADHWLDREKSNWDEWSRRMRLFAAGRGLAKWLDGTLKLPDQETYPEAHQIWKMNDGALSAFIFGNISEGDYLAVSHLQESHSVFEELRKRHSLSLLEKLNLFKKGLDIRFNVNTPLRKTINEITIIHDKIADCGIMKPDHLKCIFLVSALGYQPEFDHIAIAIMEAEDSPDFSSNTILRLLEKEEELQLFRSAFGAVKGGRVAKVTCSICKSTSHTEDSCLQPGGKRAGQSLDKARVVQRASGTSGKPPCQGKNRSSQPATGTPSVNAAATSTQQIPTGTQPIVINGLLYYPVLDTVAPPQYQ